MKKIATKLAAIAAVTVISVSGIAFADAQGIQVGLGYRQDSLKWKAHDHGVLNPRVDSHLHFKDLEILTLGAKYKGLLGCSVYTRANFDYGWVLDGRVREKVSIEDRESAGRFRHQGLFVEGDYATIFFHNKIKHSSYVWDLNLGIGTPMDFCLCEDVKFAPMVGFSYDRHHLKAGNRNNIRIEESDSEEIFSLASDSSRSGCHKGSNGGTFSTSFWGPWLGFDISYNNPGCWNLFGEFELHFGRAERERTSHSGSHFLDGYDATKNFWGPTFRVGGNYMFCDCYYLEGTLSYLYWQSYGCRDQLYWSSASVRVDLGYMF